MLPAIGRYVRQHHLGLIAVFIALGGSAYAASLPRNSVGTRQLKKNAVVSKKVKNRSLLARDFRRGQLPAGRAGRRGPQGAAGPQGEVGPQGAEGPATGAAGGDLTGSYPNPAIADGAVTSSNIFDGTIGLNDLADATKDGAAGTATLRSLGTGAQQAAAGDDARLSNARTPTGAAAGDLAGTYPNPTIGSDTLGEAEIVSASNANGLRKADIGAVVNTALAIDPPSIPAGTCIEHQTSLPGAQFGDLVIANPTQGIAAVDVTAFPLDVVAPRLDMIFCNHTAGDNNPPSRNWNVLLIR